MYWTKLFIAIGLLAASVPGLPTASSVAAPQASSGNTSPSTDSAVCKNDCCVPLQEIDPLKDLAYQNQNPKLSAAGVASATTTSKTSQPSNPVTRRELNDIDAATIEGAISRKDISKPRQVGGNSLFDTRGSGASRTFMPWESSLSSLTVFSQQECADLEQLSQGTNFKHLMDTVWAIRNALTPYGVRWAVAGGLALKIHGMQRFTTDVDIIVQTDMATLRGILLRNPAFITPGNWWPWHGVHMKAYFKYAANRGGSMPQFVEIDFILAGGLHTPFDLTPNSVSKIKKTSDNKNMVVWTMVLSRIFESKVYALATPHRAYKREKDLADATWILAKYPLAVTDASIRLDTQHRTYFVNLLVIARSPFVNKAMVYLGVHWVI